MVLIGIAIAAVVIAGAIGAWYVQDQSKAQATATVVKAEGEAKALEKGTSGASSTDIGFGLYKNEQAFESGKEKSNTLASTGKDNIAQVVADNSPKGEIDTTTGTPVTRLQPKAAEQEAAPFNMSLPKIANVIVYATIILMIFFMIRK